MIDTHPNPYTPLIHKYPLNENLIIIESFHTAISNISYITTYPERILDSYRPTTSTYRQKRVMGRLLGRVCNDHQSGHPPLLPNIYQHSVIFHCLIDECVMSIPVKNNDWKEEKKMFWRRWNTMITSKALLAYSCSKFNSFTPPFAFYVSSTIERAIGSSIELVYDNKINDFNTMTNSS